MHLIWSAGVGFAVTVLGWTLGGASAGEPERVVVAIEAAPGIQELLHVEKGRLFIAGEGEMTCVRPYEVMMVLKPDEAGVLGKRRLPYLTLEFQKPVTYAIGIDAVRGRILVNCEIRGGLGMTDGVSNIMATESLLSSRSRIDTKMRAPPFPQREAVLTDSVKRTALAKALSDVSLQGVLGWHIIGHMMEVTAEGNGFLAKVPVGNLFPFRVKGKVAFPIRSISGSDPNYLVEPPAYDLDVMPKAERSLVFHIRPKPGVDRAVLDWWRAPYYRYAMEHFRFSDIVLLPASRKTKQTDDPDR